MKTKLCSVYSQEELIGQNHRILKSGFHSKEFFLDLWKTISSGKIWKGEIKNNAKDGTIYWVFTTIVPFLNVHGRPYKYVSIRTDITEMKKIKEKITELEIINAKTAKKIAEDLAEARAKFLDIAAHELRNPVTAISLIIQIAEKKTKKSEPLTADLLPRLRAPIDRLSRLVADLFDMSRLERKLLVFNPVKTNIVSLVLTSVEEFKVLAPKF